MNECFQNPKPYLPYGVIMIAIFHAFNVPILNADEIIKLRPIDIYNHSSRR